MGAKISSTSLQERARNMRRLSLRMGEVQGQRYIGQALGMAEILAVAYGHPLSLRPDEPKWEGRDRFLLSHGHYAIAHYAALIDAGIIPESELETYGSDESRRRDRAVDRRDGDARRSRARGARGRAAGMHAGKP
jgi:transketolase